MSESIVQYVERACAEHRKFMDPAPHDGETFEAYIARRLEAELVKRL